MKWLRFNSKFIKIVSILLLLANTAYAYVPVRISVKFILDSSGNRPVVGDFTIDADVHGAVQNGNDIWSNMKSELRIDLIEIVDVPNISQHYNVPITSQNYHQLRTDAQNNPALYFWKTDAINVYISGHVGAVVSGIADLPPNNNMILMNQEGGQNSTLIHEIGHILSLVHTHDNDGCADTINDYESWDQDDIAQYNFSQPYNNLTEAQKNQVDMIFYNVMGYHALRDRFSPCQLDKQSTQGYVDRNWLYLKIPIYVNSSFTGSPQIGTFTNPYKLLQDALNAGGITGKVMVFQQGSYTLTQNQVNSQVKFVTRFGTSTISRPDKTLFTLPNLEHSKSSKVKNAIEAAKGEDTKARQAIKAGKKAASFAVKSVAKAAILSDAEEKRKQYLDKVILYLLEAEKYASGKEKIAVQLELAKRYRHSGNCSDAIKYYKIVAETTKQKYLRMKALRDAEKCKEN